MRAAIFIDGGYILTQFKQNKVNPDYTRMAEYFLAPLRRNISLDLLRVYFYYCAPWMSQEPTEDEKRRMEAHENFMEEISAIPRWTIRLGKLEKRYESGKEYFEQKRVDVLLTCDMVRHAASRDIQHAVLIAGDSDFIPAISATKDSGTTVTLWCGPPNTVHKDLVRLADEVHQLDWKRFPQVKQPHPVPAQPRLQTAASADEIKRPQQQVAKPQQHAAKPQQQNAQPRQVTQKQPPVERGAQPRQEDAEAEVNGNVAAPNTNGRSRGRRGGRRSKARKSEI